MKAAKKDINITITAPRIENVQLKIRGTAPYVQLAFSEKAKHQLAASMQKQPGDQKNKKKREPRDFDDDFKHAPHRSENGAYGIPAGAFRAAMISACRLVDFKMTIAKLSIFIKTDEFDAVEGTGLVLIDGEPTPIRNHVRNANGSCDLRVRAKFWPWSATLDVSYDAEQFKSQDVVNLMNRVGTQVGIGEGRPDSKKSCGMGWGTFEIVND